MLNLWRAQSFRDIHKECKVKLNIRENRISMISESENATRNRFQTPGDIVRDETLEEIKRIEEFRKFIGTLPTNPNTPYVPRFPGQMLVQSSFMVAVIPHLVGEKWSRLQKEISAFYATEFDLPIQAAILSRRSGKSTAVAQLIVALLYFVPNYVARIVATKIDQARVILLLVKNLAQTHFPKDMRWQFQRDIIYYNHQKGSAMIECMPGKVDVREISSLSEITTH